MVVSSRSRQPRVTGLNQRKSRTPKLLEIMRVLEHWCPGTESNRHAPFGARDFKSRASASFATRAGGCGLRYVTRLPVWFFSGFADITVRGFRVKLYQHKHMAAIRNPTSGPPVPGEI
jgi:hypothetical protein